MAPNNGFVVDLRSGIDLSGFTTGVEVGVGVGVGVVMDPLDVEGGGAPYRGLLKGFSSPMSPIVQVQRTEQ